MTKRKKITLSIILLFIAATLTIGIYFVFSNPIDRIKPLSSDEEKAIHSKILLSFPNTSIERYYGKHNGYYIHFIPSLVCVTKTKIIADSSFYHSSAFTLSAYKDGKFYKLEDVYKNGDISKEQIQKILIVHNEYEEFQKNQQN